jgi:hypothetical protein
MAKRLFIFLGLLCLTLPSPNLSPAYAQATIRNYSEVSSKIGLIAVENKKALNINFALNGHLLNTGDTGLKHGRAPQVYKLSGHFINQSQIARKITLNLGTLEDMESGLAAETGEEDLAFLGAVSTTLKYFDANAKAISETDLKKYKRESEKIISLEHGKKAQLHTLIQITLEPGERVDYLTKLVLTTYIMEPQIFNISAPISEATPAQPG